MREFKVEANVGAPQVAYRETITKHGQAGEQVRQARPAAAASTATSGIELEPQRPASGFEFVDEIVGGVIPKEYIPAVDKGIEEAMKNGVLAGFPVVDVKVSLVDGSYHEVDSSEMAFKIAGSMGFKEACRKAQPVLLEPIMKVEVVTPEDYMGDVMGDLNGRRGRFRAWRPRAGRRSSVPWCRWPRCSAMPRTCARAPRAAPPTPCSSTITSEVPASHGRSDRREVNS